MIVWVEKRYLNYEIGQVITVRDQDAKLLIPRGVVTPYVENQEEEPAIEPVKKVRRKK